MDAKFRRTESHDMNRLTPNNPAVAASPRRQSKCLNLVAPFIIDTITVATRSHTSGALLRDSLMGTLHEAVEEPARLGELAQLRGVRAAVRLTPRHVAVTFTRTIPAAPRRRNVTLSPPAGPRR